MKNTISLLSVLILIFSTGGIFAQGSKTKGASASIPDFGPAITTASLTIGTDKHSGYEAQFDFPPRSLERGWWRSLKTVARVKDRKTYWKLSVPPEKGSSNVPVEMFSEIKTRGNASTLTLVLNGTNMEAGTRKEYMQQTKNFLNEFKAKFYRDYIQALLVNAERSAKKESKTHRKAVLKREKLVSRLEKAKGKNLESEPSPEEIELEKEIKESDKALKQKAEAVEKLQTEIDFLKKVLLGYIQKSGN